jgi:hypothetical protein
MSLLFLLFLVTILLALFNREKASFVAFGVAIVASTLWFLHHASSSLTLQL